MVPVVYCIYIVSPLGYAHSETFREVAIGLQQGLAELGHVAPIVTRVHDVQGTPIVLGANLISPMPDVPCIIFNLEQYQGGWFTNEYLRLLRQHVVWDYNEANVDWLKQRGIDAAYCGIGYEPGLTTIAPQEKTVDVLFYGSTFGRRIPIIQAIHDRGLTVKNLFGVYGKARDDWIAKAKVVLNLHAYDESLFEMVRVSYLLANKMFVLSEPTVPEDLRMGIACGNPEALPELAEFYVHTPAAREGIAAEGFRLFTAKRQSEYLRPLVTERR